MRTKLPLLSAIVFSALMLSAAWAEDVLLGGADLQGRIVGNTMVGKYGDGEQWYEYFDPTGEIRGKDEQHGTYSARYEITQDLMCFDYTWDNADWCGGMSLDGDRLTFFQDGKQVTGISTTHLVPGNPFNL